MLSPRSSLLCNFVLPQVHQFSVVKILEAICSTLVLRDANTNFCGILCRTNHTGHVYMVRLFKSNFHYTMAKYSSMWSVNGFFLPSDLVTCSKYTMEMYVSLLLILLLVLPTTTIGATTATTTTPDSEKHVSHLTYNIVNLEDAAYCFRC